MTPYYATLLRVQKARHDLTAVALVWPEEGSFNQDGKWSFNAEHKDFEPLLVDIQTANLLCTVYNALSKDETRRKFRDWIRESRGKFAHLVEKSWEITSRSK